MIGEIQVTGVVDAPSSVDGGVVTAVVVVDDDVAGGSSSLPPPQPPSSSAAIVRRTTRTTISVNSSLEAVARLTIEHDSVDDAAPRVRRRTIALRLDGKAWLRVEPEVLGELGVAEGDEVGEDRRAAVEEALARARARLFVVRSLAVRMQSTAEIEKKLAARDVPPDVAREAIERVAGYGYIDDASLAGQLARGMRSRGYGRRRAEQKLRSRGLSGRLAEAAVAEAYGDHDETALAREALGRRAVVDDADRRRAIAFLARRGFSARAAWKAVQEAAEDQPPGRV